MRSWKGIVIHCSDSGWGTERDIRRWHIERGFRTTGYHFVIDNGEYHNGFRIETLDGSIETGRNINSVGAHARGYNRTHIGICLIGKGSFTRKQADALFALVNELRGKYNIRIEDVIGHNECHDSHKACPCFDVEELRKAMLWGEPAVLAEAFGHETELQFA